MKYKLKTLQIYEIKSKKYRKCGVFIKKSLIFPKFLGKNIIKNLGHLKMPVSVVAFVAFFISI
jgi:hypothetical protein